MQEEYNHGRAVCARMSSGTYSGAAKQTNNLKEIAVHMISEETQVWLMLRTIMWEDAKELARYIRGKLMTCISPVLTENG